MNLSIKNALEILGIESNFVTPDDIKNAYRKAATKYHPDKNPAGLEMMKLINAAYEVAKDFQGEVASGNSKNNYGEQVNAALNAIVDLGLTIEICGAWVWVSGDTKPHKEMLKNAGYQWSPKKSHWYFRPDEYKSRRHKSWSMQQIYSKYGRNIIQAPQLEANHC